MLKMGHSSSCSFARASRCRNNTSEIDAYTFDPVHNWLSPLIDSPLALVLRS